MGIKLMAKNLVPYQEVNEEKLEFICDTDADLAKLPKCCTGSTAVSIESGKVMVVNTQGEWVTFGG